MSDVTVNGVRLSYQVQGEGDPILLICGTGQSAATWERGVLGPLVEAGYRVITFDNRGMPPSDCPPAPYTVEEMASDTVGLLEHLALGPCRIEGGSLGALIAQEVARTRPDLVRAAVFHVGLNRLSAFGRASVKANVELYRTGVDLPGSYRKLDMVRSMLSPATMQDDTAVDAILSASVPFFDPWEDPGRVGQYEANAAWSARDHSDELRTIAVPCLAIANEHDALFPPAQIRAAAALIPNCEFVEIPGANHVNLENLAAYREAVLKFWARV